MNKDSSFGQAKLNLGTHVLGVAINKGSLIMRHHLAIAVSVSVLSFSTGYADNVLPATDPNCASLAAQFKAEAQDHARSPNWTEAEYFAAEAKSDCETGHPNAGTRVYHEALDKLAATSTSR